MSLNVKIRAVSSDSPRWRGFFRAGILVSIAALIGIVWVSIFLRTQPSPINDYQAFLQVGARLTQGDRLYVDVWDNKDPLIYWLAAIGSYERPYLPHLFELLWLLTYSVAIFVLGRKFQLSILLSLVTAGALAPLSILNLNYFPGSTELVGLALLACTFAAASSRKFVLSGLLSGVLLFAKLIYFPISVCFLAFILLREPRSGRVIRVMAGFAIAAGAFVALLIARGEWHGYIETMKINVGYSNTQTVDGSQMPASDAILSRLALFTQGVSQWLLLLIVLLLTVTWILIFRLGVRQSGTLKSAWFLVAITFSTSCLVLLVTAKLSHHLTLLSLSGVLCIILVLSTIENIEPWNLTFAAKTLRGGLIGAVILLALLASGLAAPGDQVFLTISGRDRIAASLPQDAATSWLQEHPSTRNSPIAFIGRGTQVPATATNIPWNLGCRFIGQRPSDAPWMFQETLTCLSTAKIVIVGKDAIPSEGAAEYNAFLEEVNRRLLMRFNCRTFNEIEVCSAR